MCCYGYSVSFEWNPVHINQIVGVDLSVWDVYKETVWLRRDWITDRLEFREINKGLTSKSHSNFLHIFPYIEMFSYFCIELFFRSSRLILTSDPKAPARVRIWELPFVFLKRYRKCQVQSHGNIWLWVLKWKSDLLFSFPKHRRVTSPVYSRVRGPVQGPSLHNLQH